MDKDNKVKRSIQDNRDELLKAYSTPDKTPEQVERELLMKKRRAILLGVVGLFLAFERPYLIAILLVATVLVLVKRLLSHDNWKGLFIVDLALSLIEVLSNMYIWAIVIGIGVLVYILMLPF